MAKIVLDMSMSLDGFIAGPDDDAANPLGVDGQRLHSWLGDHDGDDPRSYRPTGPSGEVFDEAMATGAVLVGRRTFELAGGWGGDHHDGVPIFVFARQPPDDPPAGPATITYVSDIESAAAQAKAAAGDRNVMVHGAATGQACLRAGVLDEMELHVIPVLLGAGRRLFDDLGTEHVELELTRVVDAPGVTHVHYRVRSASQTARAPAR